MVGAGRFSVIQRTVERGCPLLKRKSDCGQYRYILNVLWRKLVNPETALFVASEAC